MILDGEDLSDQKVAQASAALVPLHLWLKAILQAFVVSQIDDQLAQMNDQLMRLKEPLVKQLNVLDILYEANYSKLLIAGLKKIVLKEIGQPGESFDVISSNELSPASAGIGLSLAREFALPFLPIQDAFSIPGDCQWQEYEDAQGDVKRMGQQQSSMPMNARILLIENLYQDPVSIQSAVALLEQTAGVSVIACFAPFEVDEQDVEEAKQYLPCGLVGAIKLR